VPADEPLLLFRRLHALLRGLDIPHALIGGWAAVSWGVVRTTRDIDLLADIGKAIRPKLETTLEAAGFRYEWRKGGQDDPIPELLRLLHAAKPAELGLPVDVLIAMKLSAGGALDIQDARTLLKVHMGRLDEKLLRSSCVLLRVSRLLDQLLER
jgi:hypothetical protein